ncbi:MAG: hypothetical protein JNL51_04810 [Chitinophagaceae bacterium]|nr:hypothetical protein [Chitinophagaceae bacterium]
MKTLSLLLSINFTIGLPEVIIFLLAAALLGFSIHFYWAGGRKEPATEIENEMIGEESGISDADEYRLKLYEQIELREKNEERLEKELSLARSNEKLLLRQMEQMQDEIRKAEDARENKTLSVADYLSELADAQQTLEYNNRQIGRMVEQLNQLKDAERKNIDILKANESLNTELRETRHALAAKDSELKYFHQRELLSKEMNERLEKAYEEFNFLQDKLQKLKADTIIPQHKHFEYNDLQQSYFRLTKECDEIKLRNLSLLEENHRLSRLLTDTEEKLREANFQRQQHAKKTGFLEELLNDLQQVSGHNKILEGQLKRINEIETLLSRVSSETFGEK